MEETLSPASVVLIAGVNAASLLALFLLFQRHIAGMPLVPYQPRRNVPWGPGVALAAMVFPLAGIAVTLVGTQPQTDEISVVEEQTPELLGEPAEVGSDSAEFIRKGWSTIAAMLLFVIVAGAFLRVTVKADSHDLGLPPDMKQFGKDIGLGAVACIASIFPTFLIQYTLTLLVQPEHEHPMIEEFQKSYTPEMLIVGLIMVSVAAPLFEEFSFRLLLQGWLEKWEDRVIGFFPTERIQELPSDELPGGEEFIDEPLGYWETTEQHIDARTCPGAVPSLSHGWLPILISSVLFGLAHLGHGVSPIPLVLFGMVLGYLYQRTHRLVPSITAHALFNGYSMALLGLNL